MKISHSPAAEAAKAPEQVQIIEIDLADPAAAEYFEQPRVELFASLEELESTAPRQFTGILLRIREAGEDISLTAEIGGVFHSNGTPVSHYFGSLEGVSVAELAFSNPRKPGGDFSIDLIEVGNPAAWGTARLTLCAGREPELHVYLAGHCLGVLRGSVVFTFFSALRRRCECIAEA
jgi:hypothetical protein